ncbi:MAG: hypothetical protein CM1200mP28_03180 [Deltaproteobacteria bacterium]|nr:MAG: hypothetical protein CM1200mP28_03180 [Deltaproteobacteria bacterium]
MTRIQDEYDLSGESNNIDYSQFSLTPENVNMMKPESIILHPLPRRNEISPKVDADPGQCTGGNCETEYISGPPAILCVQCCTSTG